jgi:serine phosphatase RsbU (regulator of sigma subunit)
MQLLGGNGAVDDAFAMPGLDVWVFSRPFEDAAAGGDVHFVSTCATGRIARVLVADVSGHGEAVESLAGDLRGLMTRYVNFVDQRKLFGALNRKFAEIVQGGLFATAVVTTYFAPTQTLSVSNAGHPPPLVWRRGEGWSFLNDTRSKSKPQQPANVPLGVIDAVRYDQFDVPLATGDLVLCYTDSLSESRGTDGELLSMDGLLEVANDIDGESAADVIPAFVTKLRELNAKNLDGDDVTLLLFRPDGGRQSVPFLDRLAAPGRVFRGLVGSLRSGWRSAPWPEVSLKNLGGAMFDGFNRRG